MQSNEITNGRLAEMIAEQNRWLAEEERIEKQREKYGKVSQCPCVECGQAGNVQHNEYVKAWACPSCGRIQSIPVVAA